MTQAVTLSGLGSTAPIINSPVLTAPVLGTPASGSLVNCTDVNYTGFKNRIINGGMVIDQRNAGASGTNANAFTVDRWHYYASQASKFTWGQNLNSITPPTGFTNYLGLQSSSAYTALTTDVFEMFQPIEGYNVADLGFGTADAKPVTISAWVRSSLTGTFGGFLSNSPSTRFYFFTYSIPVANTWTQVSIAIVGDTTGTWLTTNGNGLVISFTLSSATGGGTVGSWTGTVANYPAGTVSVVGTSGATFYITGVQLEKGSVATSFDYRPYGTELSLCQRYYEIIKGGISAYAATATIARCGYKLGVTKRALVSLDKQVTGNSLVNNLAGNPLITSYILGGTSNVENLQMDITVASGLTAAQGVCVYIIDPLSVTAEL